MSESRGVWCGVGGRFAALMSSVLAAEVGFLGIPPVTSEVADAVEGVVVQSRHLAHVESLLGFLPYAITIKAASQGALDAATEVGECVAQGRSCRARLFLRRPQRQSR